MKETSQEKTKDPGAWMLVPVTELKADPGNVRSAALKGNAADADLVASVKAQGILQPLLVRYIAKNQPFVVVAGHRRLAAAKAAGLDKVPCVVQTMTDDEAREKQLVENLQRDDLTPMDEAKAFKGLLQGGHTYADLGARTGKSQSYIHERVGLLTLSPNVQAAVKEWLPLSWAVEFRRIPDHPSQDQLLAKIKKDEHGAPESLAELVQVIEKEYGLNLSRAAFSKKDPNLVEGVCACEACPKRTGAQNDLFGEASKADLCQDGTCFRNKVKAHTAQLAEKAKAAGQRVVYGDASRKILGPHGDGQHPWRRTSYQAGYGSTTPGDVALKALGLHDDKQVVVAVDDMGNPHRMADVEWLRKQIDKYDRSTAAKKRTPKSAAAKKEEASAARARAQRKLADEAEAYSRVELARLVAKKLQAIPASLLPGLSAWADENYMGCEDELESLGFQGKDDPQKFMDTFKDQYLMLAVRIIAAYRMEQSLKMAARFGVKPDKAKLKAQGLALVKAHHEAANKNVFQEQLKKEKQEGTGAFAKKASAKKKGGKK